MPATTKSFEKSLLLDRLAALRARTRLHLAIDGIASTSLAFVSICLLSFGVDRVFRLPRGQRAFMLVLLGSVCGVLIWRRLVARLRVALPLVELARAVEKMAPQLDWRLVSAVQFLENQDPRGSKELAQLVVADAERLAEPLRFSDVLDTQAVARRAFRGAVTLAAGLALVVPGNFRPIARTWFERCVLLSSTVEWPKDTQLTVTTQCGQVVTEIKDGRLRVAVPRGSDLAVVVSARGVIPTRASLSFEFAQSRIRGSRPLARLGDNRFRHIFEKVVEDCDFYVRGGDDEVGPIHVSVVRPPWIDGLTITAEPPRYTRVPKKTFGIEAGEMPLPVGTKVTVSAHCTKVLKDGWLDVRFAGTRLDAAPDHHDAVIAVDSSSTPGTPRGATLTASFVLDKTAACTIDVRDEDELALERPVALTLRGIPDAPPKVQLMAQGIGQLITPDCTIPIDVKATDDYGLVAGVLKWKTAGPNQKPAEGEIPIPRLLGLIREHDDVFEWDVSTLHLTAGTFLNFIVEVVDDDPKGRKVATSSSIALRVVNPEELLMDLIRRQHELRRELERVREDEVKLAEGLDAIDTKVLERAGKKQREVQKTVADAARAMTQVVEEMRNNKLLDDRARARLQDDVVGPLENLRDNELVRARELADAALAGKDADREAKAHDAAGSSREVVAQLETIIAHMRRVADLAELVARLREFLKKQRDLMEETRKQSPPR